MGKVLSLVNELKDEDFTIISKNKGSSLSDVESELRRMKIQYEVKNKNHVKIGPVNYYPSTGTVYVDGMEARFKQKGFEFLKQVLKRVRVT